MFNRIYFFTLSEQQTICEKSHGEVHTHLSVRRTIFCPGYQAKLCGRINGPKTNIKTSRPSSFIKQILVHLSEGFSLMPASKMLSHE
ncbi:CLUMA_CG002958, isoform A [Clunio marinus]|uniref:CLUMA_CG002958, isoform A n=1 Tax=Clunio marinus TaxID=568069 RepID=A0A1J1HRU0_9DIPT|nr:CLUMA_CG002958, isoform A [Clunio marinus]